MVRFLLKTLLVKSGEQEGALLLCVARVKKGGGEFLGGGELIGGIRYVMISSYVVPISYNDFLCC